MDQFKGLPVARLPAAIGWRCEQLIWRCWFAVLLVTVGSRARSTPTGCAGASAVGARFWVLWSERSCRILATRRPSALTDVVVSESQKVC